jgi:hypothetical protein
MENPGKQIHQNGIHETETCSLLSSELNNA